MTDASMPPDVLLRHALWLRSLARHLVEDESRADDVVQDTWVAALEHPPAQPGSTRAWLARVARRFASGERERDAARGRWERSAARDESQPSTGDLVEKLALERAVVDAVLSLPEPQREVVLLRYYEELAPRDVAARLGLGLNVYWARLKRAHELLRQDLRGRLDLRPGSDERVDWRMALAPLAGLPPALTTSGGSVAAGTLLTTWITMSTKTIAALAVVALGAAGWWWLESRPSSEPENAPSADPGAGLSRVADEDRKREFLNAEPQDRSETLRSAASEPARTPEKGAAVAGQAAGTRVHGLIVDQQGHPVPLANVVLAPRERGSDLGIEGRLVFVDRNDENQPGARKRETSTDAQGRFAFAGIGDAGSYQIDVQHALLLSPRHRFAIEAEKEVDVGTLSLRLGAAVHGKVVDHLAQPIPGTWVRAQEVQDSTAHWTVYSIGGHAHTDLPLTDAEGRFRAGPFDPEIRHELLVSAPGTPRVTVPLKDLVAGVDTELQPISVDRASSLSGHVIDSQSKPVAKANVMAMPGAKQVFDLRGLPIDMPVLSDAEGRFEIRGLSPGTYTVSASLDRGSARAETVAHDAQGVELRFRATNRVEGIVRDAKTEELVANARVNVELDFDAGGAHVRMMPQAHHSIQEAVLTDAKGRFVFEDLPANAYRFRVSSPQHAPAVHGPIDVPSGGLSDLILAVEPGVELVVDVFSAADSKPLAEATVELFVPRKKPIEEAPGASGERRMTIGMRTRTATPSGLLEDFTGPDDARRMKLTTDAEGRARFGGLEARDYELVASHGAHASTQRTVQVKAAGSNAERLDLRRGGTLVGRALAFGGAPLSERDIVVRADDERRSGTHRTKTDAKGEFRLDHVAAGAYTARLNDRAQDALISGDMAFSFASLEGDEPKKEDGVAAQIVEGQTTEIELRQSPRATLEVLVLDGGLPVADARVEVQPKSDGPSMPMFPGMQSGRPTNAEGLVRFEDLEPGTYKVTWGPAAAQIRDEREIELAAEAQERLELDLPGGAVAGVVEDEQTKRPIAGANIEIQRAGGSGPRRAGAVMISRAVNSGGSGSDTTMVLGGPSPVRTDAEGRFRFEHLPAGQYELVMQADGYGKETTPPFALAAREKLEDRVESLNAGGIVEGAFTGLEGESEGMVLVTATLLDEKGAPSGQPTRSPTQIGSRYSLEGLKPGRYRISARLLVFNAGGGGREAQSVEVDVEAGQKKTQDLRF